MENVNELYPLLVEITKHTPGTVIDPEWENIISPEVLAELKILMMCDTYDLILHMAEGLTVEQALKDEKTRLGQMALVEIEEEAYDIALHKFNATREPYNRILSGTDSDAFSLWYYLQVYPEN